MLGLIMIGGRGARFWPSSRIDCPKQLLDLYGQGPMIEVTANRMKDLIKPDDMYIVTSKHLVKKIKDIVPEYSNIIGEPEGRNTAPCIAMITGLLLKKHSDKVIGIFPGDHFISKKQEFLNILKTAEKYALENDALITIGIKPEFPHTGYGYIEYNKTGKQICDVIKFYEKPDFNTAQKFVDSGNFLWNAGIFIWKISTITNAFKKYEPEMYESIITISSADENNLDSVIEQEYKKMKKVSIDYAIMEKSGNIKTIPADIGWNDIGSWSAISDINETDNNGNVINTKNKVLINSKNNIVYSKNKLVSIVDVNNLIVVDTGDALLICNKNSDQKVKDIVTEIENKGLNEYL